MWAGPETIFCPNRDRGYLGQYKDLGSPIDRTSAPGSRSFPDGEDLRDDLLSAPGVLAEAGAVQRGGAPSSCWGPQCTAARGA